MSISAAGSLSTIQCYFCGGAGCKYENWKLWIDKGNNAFDDRITNTILAMQRPSSRLMKEYDLITKFKVAGIGAIFNLQQPKEHAGCGDGLDPNSDFSYVPEDWMEAGISYLQYGWVDMDTPHCELILGAVQLMSYMIGSGKKVAVHCHAGLGRTGLLIASYLIFDKHMTPLEAQQLVRLARPGSIQNKKQTAFLGIFENYLTKLRFYYPQMMMSGMMSTPSQTFLDILQNQSICLHGKEQRRLKWVPKPIYLLSNHLKSLYQTPKNRMLIIDEIEHLDYHLNTEEFITLQSKINCGEWSIIDTLDIKFTVHLLLIFFLSIKESLIDHEFISHLEKSDTLEKNILLHQRLDLGILTTICIILDIFKINDASMNNNIESVFIQLAGIFSPERPSWIPTDTLQVSTRGLNSLNLNLKLPQMPKFFQDWTGIGKQFRRKMSVPVWNIYETLQYIFKTYNIAEDEMSIVPVDESGRIETTYSASSNSSQNIAESNISFPVSASNNTLDYGASMNESPIMLNSGYESSTENNIKKEISQSDNMKGANLEDFEKEADMKEIGNIPDQDVSLDPNACLPKNGDHSFNISGNQDENATELNNLQKQMVDGVLVGGLDETPPDLGNLGKQAVDSIDHSCGDSISHGLEWHCDAETQNESAPGSESNSPPIFTLLAKEFAITDPALVPSEDLQANTKSDENTQNENDSIVPTGNL